MKKKKKKCYTYIRVSTAMQVDGYSLEAQKERLTKFAEFQDMEIVREYCDAGKSGKSITGRPEFSRMLQDVSDERDHVDYILVFKLSRFGRNAADVLNSLQHIQDYGVNLICVEDGIDSSKDSGKLTITVLSAVAEIERENILVQTMEGRKQKAREGKWNGGQAPFGYDLDSPNGTLTVNPGEAEIVRIIFDRFVHSDMGTQAISDYLNRHGYTKKKVRGRELNYFSRSLVVRILDNPVYIGKIAYGKSSTEKVKGTRDVYRRVQQEEFLLADGIHDAIIDMDTWEAARMKREKTGVKWVKTHSLDHEHILSGIIKCPQCGGGMTGTVRRRKNKSTGEYTDTFFYRCHHRKNLEDGRVCDYKPTLNQEAFNAEVVNFIRYMISNDEFRDYVQDKLGEKVDVSALETEREQLRGQLQQVQGAKTKLLQMMERMDVNDKHYDQKFQDMQDRLDNLYDRISGLEEAIEEAGAKITASYGNQINTKELYKILLDYDNIYEKMTDAEKKEFMGTLIESIELYPERTDTGRIIRRIILTFPVYYDGHESREMWLPEENTVETVVLLRYQGSGSYIHVKYEPENGDYMKTLPSSATYTEIKKWVSENYGFNVTSLYVAQIKREFGIIERENYNKPKSDDPKFLICPPEKREAIIAAFKHFGMIQN